MSSEIKEKKNEKSIDKTKRKCYYDCNPREKVSDEKGSFRNNWKLGKGGLGPMDTFESKTQYVSGTADDKSCEKSLYHRS